MTTFDSRLAGTLSPVLTPFNADGTVCPRRFIEHCERLLEQDVGLALFGTNSESASMTLSEKRKLLEALHAANLPPERMLVGVGACALAEVIELTQAALAGGSSSVLMVPPFYYKGVSDEGLFRSVAQVIETIGDARLRIYLYHIPTVSQVPFSLPLIARLLAAYPGVIAGIKDSSGDLNHALSLLHEFRNARFDVFAGSETHLVEMMRAGCAGVISATANVNGAAIARLCHRWDAVDGQVEQDAANRLRAAFARFAMIPAMKAATAAQLDDPVWTRVRAPLVELPAEQQASLLKELTALGFYTRQELPA